MQRATIVLDAWMPVSAVLQRLARHGLWRDVAHPDAQLVITEVAKRLSRDASLVARRLAREARLFGVAIRRTMGANVLWYGRRAEEVLDACLNCPRDERLIAALNLHEHESEVPWPGGAVRSPGRGGLVANGGEIAFDDAIAPGPAVSRAPDASQDLTTWPPRSTSRSGGGTRAPGEVPPSPDPAPRLRAWPLLDAPPTVEARRPFDVTVGLSPQAEGASGSAMDLPLAAGANAVELTVELVADGFDVLGGWQRALRAEVNKLDAARVTFQLVPFDPPNDEGVLLTTIGARFVHQGVVCGTASRPLIVHRAGSAPPATDRRGRPWLDQPPLATPIAPPDLAQAADLTIEISHPEANPARGRYHCSLLTPHPVAIDTTPRVIELGDDAKTFARHIVEQVRQFAGDDLTENLFEALGGLVADKLPRGVFDAIAAVAAHVARVPAVLLVSAEPYVPWELATLAPRLDPSRPACLGAQVLLGRWWREGPANGPTGPAGRSTRPSADPPARIAVGAMAVMAAQYKAESGLRRLPLAEQEGKDLAQAYDAVLLSASTGALKQLLDAKVEQGLESIGAVDVVHFAGHGEFDPSRPDGSMMFLADGKPLASFLFRSAKYGDAHQPLAFFNACMIGIGGELLGDAGGFPGNCLRGGFGGIQGALWEVDDAVARDVAVEFWRRALPPPQGQGEPVAAVWRDLRARFAPADGKPPEATYLSYVFYGHPRLTLERRV